MNQGYARCHGCRCCHGRELGANKEKGLQLSLCISYENEGVYARSVMIIRALL